MLVIIYKTVVFHIVGVALIFYYINALVPFCGACSLIDVVGRHNLNDSFISVYYLLWTLFFYLPESFLSLFVILCYLSTSWGTLSKVTIVLFLVNNLYIVELVDFISINSSLTQVVSIETWTNSLLLNLLNRYHPFIFYTSVVLIMYIVSLFMMLSTSLLNQFLINSVAHTTEFKVILVVFLNWLALWLGGWWAFQEGTWGGWWNSDISEMLGLLITLIGLVYLHVRIPHLKLRSVTLFLYVCLASFLCVYYFIQINYELTSHNFGSRFFFFFNNNLLLLELLFILVSSIMATLISGIKYSTSNSYIDFSIVFSDINFRKIFFSFKVYLLIFFYIWLLISLLPLVDLSTQKYIHITDLLLSDAYPVITLSFLLSVVYMFFELDLHYVISCSFLLAATTTFSSLLTPSYSIKWTNSRIVHLLLTCFLLVNIQSSDLVFLYWGHTTQYTPLYFSDEVFFFHNMLFVCDANSFNRLNVSSTCGGVMSSSWSSSHLNNSYDVDQFFLSHSVNTLFNYFYFLDNWVKIFILIESTNVNVLSVLSTLNVLYLICGFTVWYAYAVQPQSNY